MPAEDVTFTFDPQPFRKGVESVRNSMTSLQSGTENVAKGMSRGLMRVARRVTGLAVGFLGVRSVIRKMPEIGQAFSIAGEVLTQNLLWPLRKTLFPLLQRMLDWVRDHRAMFVKWGEGIVGVLKGAWEIAKVFWDALKGVASIFQDTFQRMFPFLNRSVSDTLNLLQFKMVVTARMLEDVFQKVAEFWRDSGLQSLWNTMFRVVTDIVTATREMALAFGAGYLSKISLVKDSFSSLVTALENLLIAIFGDGDGNGLERAKEIMYAFGQVMATVVAVGVETAANIIQDLADRIQGLKDAIGDGEWMRALENIPFTGDIIRGFRENREEGGGIFGGIGEAAENVWEGSLLNKALEAARERLGGEEAQDFVMRPGQAAVRFSPQDTIIGTKNPAGFGNATINIDMSGTQLNVTEGDAEAAGQNFVIGLGEQIRQELLNDMTRAGQ